MYARNCGEATGEPDMKSNECRKLLRGTGGKFRKNRNKMNARSCGDAMGKV